VSVASLTVDRLGIPHELVVDSLTVDSDRAAQTIKLPTTYLVGGRRSSSRRTSSRPRPR